MTGELAIALALVLPLLCALVVGRLDTSPNVREAASLVTGGLLFGTVLQLLPMVQAGARPRLEVLEVLPGLSFAFEVEPLGMLFAMVASGLWIVTTAYAVGYMRGHHEVNQTRFFKYFAVAISATMAVAFAANLFTLFAAYEILTLSTYPLVTHHQTDKARNAGRVYLGILLSTSVGLLLLAVIWTYFAAGTLEFQPGGILTGKVEGWQVGLLLALYAFGTGKAALMPFHRWLPAAMVAPTPVSALLHAVAVVKAGVFTVTKVVVYVFGLELLSSSGTSIWLMYVAAFTILAASVVALMKDNLKARLAYSTISQLAYIVLGAALANASGILGGSMHIAMHAFGKITLFFCAGAIMVAAHKTKVSELDGIGRTMPVTMTAFFIGSLSIIGLPPFGGAWSKWFLGLGAVGAHQVVFLLVLMASSLLSVAYLMPIVGRAFFIAPAVAEAGHGVGASNPGHGHGAANPGHEHRSEDHGHDQGSGIREAPLWMVIPLCITALGTLVLFFMADALYQLLAPLVGS
jgi:multicomponent Na+:H+ antiporter subunit D